MVSKRFKPGPDEMQHLCSDEILDIYDRVRKDDYDYYKEVPVDSALNTLARNQGLSGIQHQYKQKTGYNCSANAAIIRTLEEICDIDQRTEGGLSTEQIVQSFWNRIRTGNTRIPSTSLLAEQREKAARQKLHGYNNGQRQSL